MWEYSHEGKQLENKWVFRQLQKTGKVCADVKEWYCCVYGCITVRLFFILCREKYVIQ